MPSHDKKNEDHNTGVSYEKPYQEFQNSALSRYVIRNIKKYFIKTFIKNLKTDLLTN